jgi:hypothetical protein
MRQLTEVAPKPHVHADASLSILLLQSVLAFPWSFPFLRFNIRVLVIIRFYSLRNVFIGVPITAHFVGLGIMIAPRVQTPTHHVLFSDFYG